jgi:ABC-type polysaccharide/polyol phosphate export permease
MLLNLVSYACFDHPTKLGYIPLADYHRETNVEAQQPHSLLLPKRITLIQALLNFLILATAMLTAVQFRVSLDLGRALGAGYTPHFTQLYLILFLAVIASYTLALAWQLVRSDSQLLAVDQQFKLLWVALGLADVVILVFLPDVSQLQMIYFSIMATFLGGCLVLIPKRLRASARRDISILDNLQQILEHRFLIQIWTSYRIRARYTQTALGILWIVIIPIMEALVIAFAFSQLLGSGQRDVPWVIFILSGRVAFDIFNRLVSRGKTAIQSMAAVIQQVYFPRELIIILLATEIMVDFLFAFGGFVVLALFYGITPNIYYLLLPIPIFLMLMLAIGFSFVVAWLGLLVRDIQPLVQIALQLLFYVTVFYDPKTVASNLSYISLINPLSAIVEVFRSIVIYNEMPNLAVLYLPIALSIAILYTGYIFYKVNEDRFTDYI